MKRAIMYGLVLGGAHFVFLGMFAIGSHFGMAQNALIALSMTVDLPVVFVLEGLRTLSLVDDDIFSGNLTVLYVIYMFIGSVFYFVIGASIGWFFAKLGKK